MKTNHSFGKVSVNSRPVSGVEKTLRGSPGQGKQGSQVDGVSIWHPSSSSVALWGKGSEKEQWPLPTFMSRRKLSPNSHLDARHFSSFPYTTGAFQAATLVLELSAGVIESE